MTYEAVLDYLTQQLPMFQRIGAAAYKANLKNITKLCTAIGNPQNNLKCIHVAGTNGKGSVTHIIASILKEQGYRVGIFTSPHYKDFRERIKINSTLIPKRFVIDFVTKNKKLFDKIEPSFFELTTAMAFAYFSTQDVDYCVIETGLGGRLDSTNIITPILSVITNISFDHQQFLGETIKEIAEEKAGIIKPGVPVVVGETDEETAPVFKRFAKKHNAAIHFADEVYSIQNFQPFTEYTMLDIHLYDHSLVHDIRTDIGGKYQQQNIVTAMMAAFVLNEIGVDIKLRSIVRGFKKVKKNTYFIGRWMVQQLKPLIVFDSAHNEGGIRVLLEQLDDIKFKKLHFVYGVVNDKDIGKIIVQLPKVAQYYFCKPNIPRGLETDKLLTKAAIFGLEGDAYPTVADALEAAKANALEDDMILVAGSIFVVAEVI